MKFHFFMAENNRVYTLGNRPKPPSIFFLVVLQGSIMEVVEDVQTLRLF